MKSLFRRASLTLLLSFLTATVLQAASADADWDVVVELDKGPTSVPKTRDEALKLAREHFKRHREAVEVFIRRHPDDPRTFDARLRLASLDAAEGKMDGKPQMVTAALRELMKLEQTPGIPREKQADATFRRISLQMQTLEGRDQEIRDAVVTAARNFAARFPEDRRAPRLLVEAATLCDEVPDTMRSLLERARTLSKEPALNARIADDIRRMESLGNPVSARFETIDGKTIDLERLRGKVVVLVFWAAESPHCLVWMQGFIDNIRKIPKDDLAIIMVSLDESRSSLDSAMRHFKIDWPTHFDGKGWENSVARPLGINAIPTVWILDKAGNLRNLNARDAYPQWIRNLQIESGGRPR